MRQLWDFPGGVHPPEHKAQSLGEPLHTLELPPEIVLAVAQHSGQPAEATVSVGDKVLKGQLIAAGQSAFSANVHASTSGTVTAIENRPLPHPSGLTDQCIVIEPDGEDQWMERHGCTDYTGMDRGQLLEKIQAAGIVGMGGAGFPTSAKLSGQFDINTLIINGTECEPYITADDILMQTQAADIVRGIQLLHHLLEYPPEVLIAIEDNKPDAIAAMREAVEAADDPRLDVVPLPVKYPSGGEKQLVQMLTGREVPSGKLPAHVGAVCQNIATVLAAYRAVHFDEPLISRITTVTGEAFATQRNIAVRLGTPIQFVLEQHGYDSDKASRLVMGGPMMGFTLLDPRAPVIKTTNCLLAPSREESPPPGPAQACIRCGMCSEACPANLLPQQLYWYARAEDEEKLRAYHLFDCIECGACSYVCPSQIPLVQYYRAAKGEIRQREIEKAHSDRARERFEFHKQRVEAEKAARDKAREEAARKAKEKKQAKAKAATADAHTAATKDKTPTAPSTKKTTSPDAERARLERNLLSIQDRLQKLRAKLEEQPDKAEATRARIKEAEVKEQTLRDKLASLDEKSAPAAKFETEKEEATAVSPKSEAPEINDAQQRQIARLEQQLAKTEQRLAETDPNQHDDAAALELSINILKEKLKAARTQPGDSREPGKSDVEQLQQHIARLQSRLQATRQKLDQADDDITAEALEKSMTDLENKLTDAQQQLVAAQQS